MPTYEIQAPDGNKYRIDGPPGATDEQIRSQILKQHPNAGQKPSTADSKPSYVAGLGNELYGAAKGFASFVPGAKDVVEEIESGVTGKPTQPIGTTFGLPGPYGGATPQQVANVEKVGRGIANTNPFQVGAEIVKGAGETLSTVGKGLFSPPTTAEAQQKFGEEAVNLITLGKFGTDAFNIAVKKVSEGMVASERAALQKALNSGNRDKVSEILNKRKMQLEKDASNSRLIASSNIDEMKRRLESHRQNIETAKAKHAEELSKIDLDIAEAKRTFNADKERQLTEIKSGSLERQEKLEREEQNKIADLLKAHEDSVSKAQREYDAAKQAAESIANAKQLKLSKERVASLRRQLDAYGRRTITDEARTVAGFPQADNVVGASGIRSPLSVEIVDEIETRMNVEEARIASSTFYQQFKSRVDALRKEGKVWGRDSQTGVALRDSLRKTLKADASATESPVSTYKRRYASRLLPLLEQTPEPVMGVGPRGGRKIVDLPPPVPVDPNEALNVLREVKKDVYRMKSSGSPYWVEIDDFAKTIESSLSSFVGEEFMPQAKYRDLHAYLNELEGTEVGRIAAGRKEAPFLPVDKSNRFVPVENVEREIFKDSDRIKNYRNVLRDDEKFSEHVNRHIANELSGMTGDEIRKWLASKGQWVDHIDMPGLRDQVHTFASSVDEQAGKLFEAKKSRDEIERRLTAREKDVSDQLSAIAKEQESALAAAEKEKAKAMSQSKRQTVAGIKAARSEKAANKAMVESEELFQKQRVLDESRQKKSSISDMERARQEKASGHEQFLSEQNLIGLGIKSDVRTGISQARETIAASKKKEQLANKIESVIFSRGPVAAKNSFAKLKPQLVSSGVMTEEEAASIAADLEADVSASIDAKAYVRNRTKVRKTLSRWALGAVGAAGGSYGVYKAMGN